MPRRRSRALTSRPSRPPASTRSPSPTSWLRLSTPTLEQQTDGAAGAQSADDDVVDADYEVVDDEDQVIMSARKARTEAAAAGAAPVYSEEKDVKIPVEAAGVAEANEAEAAEAAENQVEDSNKEATMTEDEMVEAAIRAGEEPRQRL